MINKKTRKMMCLAEAKKFDLDQGTAQCLIGCEAISDHEGSNVVYGIVSSYFKWIFYASRNVIDMRLLQSAVTASIQIVVLNLNSC